MADMATSGRFRQESRESTQTGSKMMETRTEWRKRMEARRRKQAARSVVLCLIIAVLFLIMVMGFSVDGRSASNTEARPSGVELIAVGEDDAEFLRLVAAASSDAELQPKEWPQEEVEAIAKTVYGESMITGSDMGMAAVAWCILNRVDSPAYPDSIMEVITANWQFHGYDEENPVDPHIRNLVVDVLNRWDAERNGEKDVGRVLPAEYLFFWGDGWNNHFTTEYLSGDEWDWSLQNPYDT